MGFGLNLNAGGDYLPVLKYDARAGRLFRMDRDEVTGEQDPVDITEAFEAAVDFAHGEAGWCWFQAGQAPDFVMVPIGEALPPQPTKNHKQGVRLRPPVVVEGRRRQGAAARIGERASIDGSHTATAADCDEEAMTAMAFFKNNGGPAYLDKPANRTWAGEPATWLAGRAA